MHNKSLHSRPMLIDRLMKESIKSNAAGFSARRMVKQYIEKFYSKSIQKALKD